MQIQNKILKRRIIEISYKKKLSHIGSCLSTVDTIIDLYKIMKEGDRFILSNGHSALALYCILEQYWGKNAEDIFDHHGVHPDRCNSCHIDASSGSLGHGLPIALGMGLADKDKEVYCIVSDGECSEGSIWEAFRIQKELYVTNLHVYVILNGYGAYKKINPMALNNQIEYMSWAKPVWVNMDDYPQTMNWLKTQEAHYRIMDEFDYREFMGILL